MSDQVDYDAIRAESAAAWDKMQAQKECARRLARYDEAIELLQTAQNGADLISFDFAGRLNAFLAAEPKEGR